MLYTCGFLGPGMHLPSFSEFINLFLVSFIAFEFDLCLQSGYCVRSFTCYKSQDLMLAR